MTINFVTVMLLVIVLILFNSSVYAIQHRCHSDSIKIPYIRAGRLQNRTEIEDRIGITSVNLKLDRDIPCGVYKLGTNYGNATMFVGKESLRLGYLVYAQKILGLDPQTKKDIDKADLFDLWNLDRVSQKNDDFINTYNGGCC